MSPLVLLMEELGRQPPSVRTRDAVWEQIRAYKGTASYENRLIAAIAHRATLGSRWSAL